MRYFRRETCELKVIDKLIALVHCILQSFTSFKSRNLCSSNLNLFTGLWVSTGTCSSITNAKGAKTY